MLKAVEAPVGVNSLDGLAFVVTRPTDPHPFIRVLSALESLDCRVQRRGHDSARCTCPSHRDTRPSLVVTRKNDRVLMKCFAGCRLGDIVAALGLRVSDLFSGPRTQCMNPPAIVATYDYIDCNGELIGQKVRLEPKSFRWRTPVETLGGWRWGLQGAIVGLYHAPDLIDARQILLVEGEKAADELWRHGFPATCPPTGASTWTLRWSAQLWRLGCVEVVVIPDHDRAGHDHAQRVAAACYAPATLAVVEHGDDEAHPLRSLPAAALTSAELSMRVKVVELDNLAPGADVFDWFRDGGTSEQLRELIAGAPLWTPDAVARERLERKRAKTRERVRKYRARKQGAQTIVRLAG
jgi:putative DNA primase/helicase